MKKTIKKVLGVILLLLFVTGAWLYFSYSRFLQEPLHVQKEMTIEIQSGSSATEIVVLLDKHQLISNPYFTRLYWRLNHLEHKLRSGTYAIHVGDTLPELTQKIVDGSEVTYQVTLVEGWNLKQLRDFLKEQKQLKQLTHEMSEEELIKALHIPFSKLEGLFFPDTYQFTTGYSDLDLLKRAHQVLMIQLQEAWKKKQQDLPYETAYEALIMASIIEKETGLASERNTIAGVFVRRLRKGMRLQTDPTVIYGIGENFDGNLTRKHLKTDTPYNTYTRHGLPPSPISLVGMASIEAALQPEKGHSLYFVAKGDGSHYFSDNLNEHNAAVRQYQLQKKNKKNHHAK